MTHKGLFVSDDIGAQFPISISRLDDLRIRVDATSCADARTFYSKLLFDLSGWEGMEIEHKRDALANGSVIIGARFYLAEVLPGSPPLSFNMALCDGLPVILMLFDGPFHCNKFYSFLCKNTDRLQ